MFAGLAAGIGGGLGGKAIVKAYDGGTIAQKIGGAAGGLFIAAVAIAIFVVVVAPSVDMFAVLVTCGVATLVGGAIGAG